MLSKKIITKYDLGTSKIFSNYECLWKNKQINLIEYADFLVNIIIVFIILSTYLLFQKLLNLILSFCKNKFNICDKEHISNT